MNLRNKSGEEITDLYRKNQERIDYFAGRVFEKMAREYHRKHDRNALLQMAEWTSPEGALFWVFVDARYECVVAYPLIRSGRIDRPQFYSPIRAYSQPGAYADLYTHHFFERYRQRNCKLQLPLQEVVKRYMTANPSDMCIWKNTDRTSRVYAVRQGIVLAREDQTRHVITATTFVSNDMLGDRQREAKEVIKHLLDEQDRLYSGRMPMADGERLPDIDRAIGAAYKTLTPFAQDIYNQYFEDAEEDV